MDSENQAKTLDIRRFAAIFAESPNEFSWLIGAGSSAAAGIPTATMMIADFRKQMYCRESGVPPGIVDGSDPLWVSRIDALLDQRSGVPQKGSLDEYSSAFENVFPTLASRREYIERAIRQGTPTFGHRVLAALMATKRVPGIFTTNFDQLIEIAITHADQLVDPADRALPIVAALDSAGRAERFVRDGVGPLVAKLHGDYQSVQLKNTSLELRNQDMQLRAALSKACQMHGLIVIGYSGRDKSVIQTLRDALKHAAPFPRGLFWITRARESIAEHVGSLLNDAAASGVSATVVEAANFDELLGELVGQFELPPRLQDHVFELRAKSLVANVPIPAREALRFPVLRSSAFPVLRFPEQARRLQLRVQQPLAEIRRVLRTAKVRAAVAHAGECIAAFGADKDLLAALAPFGAEMDGVIELKPDQDSWALGLIYDAFVQSLCLRRPLVPKLRRSGHTILISKEVDGAQSEKRAWRDKTLANLHFAYGSSLGGSVPKTSISFREGVRVRLEKFDGKWWCVFDPFTHIDRKDDGSSEEHARPSDSLENDVEYSSALEWEGRDGPRSTIGHGIRSFLNGLAC